MLKGSNSNKYPYGGITNSLPIYFGLKKAGHRLAENIYPFGYQRPMQRLNDAVIKNRKSTLVDEIGKSREPYAFEKERIDLLHMLFNAPQKYKTIVESKYKPAISTDKNKKYYSSPDTENELAQLIKSGRASDRRSFEDYDNMLKKDNLSHVSATLGNIKLAFAEDNEGEYLSYYDKWDLNPVPKSGIGFIDKAVDKVVTGIPNTLGLTSTPEVYGRVYLPNKNQSSVGDVTNSPNMKQLPIIRRRGGNIYFLGSDLSFSDMMKDPNTQAGLAGVGSELIGAIEDNPANKVAGVGKGALTGFSAGMSTGIPLLGVAGALAGGAAGLLGANKAQEAQLLAENKAGASRFKAGTAGVDPSAHIYANGSRLTEFNEGGRHEENPLGGVPQGVGENGEPNLVEEGETKHKDYIFSDRLALANGNHYNLGGKFNGKSFADISKKISKFAAERPHDPIAQRGQQAMLSRLQVANDDAKMFKEYEESNPAQHFNSRVDTVEPDKVFKFGGYIFKDF